MQPAGVDDHVVEPAHIWQSRLPARFKDKGPRGYSVVMVFAKQQRGAMARHIIRHRLLEPEAIKAYTGDGYRFAPDESTATEWVFLRDKRPPLVTKPIKGGRIR
mgnify:CR=1 FL=1